MEINCFQNAELGVRKVEYFTYLNVLSANKTMRLCCEDEAFHNFPVIIYMGFTTREFYYNSNL